MKKTILKALVYRVIIILSQLICLFLYTGNIKVSIEFALLFGIVSTIEYIILEKIWR